MRKIAYCIAALGVSATLSACQTTRESDDLGELSVRFSWNGIERCSSQSPGFQIGNIPPATERLRFRMVDLNVPSFNHGGGTVRYDGTGAISRGAFTFVGPCPPVGSHTYQFTVDALDASGLVIARGTAARSFP